MRKLRFQIQYQCFIAKPIKCSCMQLTFCKSLWHYRLKPSSSVYLDLFMVLAPKPNNFPVGSPFSPPHVNLCSFCQALMLLNCFYSVSAIRLKETSNSGKDQLWQLKYFINSAGFMPMHVNLCDVPFPSYIFVLKFQFLIFICFVCRLKKCGQQQTSTFPNTLSYLVVVT